MKRLKNWWHHLWQRKHHQTNTEDAKVPEREILKQAETEIIIANADGLPETQITAQQDLRIDSQVDSINFESEPVEAAITASIEQDEEVAENLTASYPLRLQEVTDNYTPEDQAKRDELVASRDQAASKQKEAEKALALAKANVDPSKLDANRKLAIRSWVVQLVIISIAGFSYFLNLDGLQFAMGGVLIAAYVLAVILAIIEGELIKQTGKAAGEGNQPRARLFGLILILLISVLTYTNFASAEIEASYYETEYVDEGLSELVSRSPLVSSLIVVLVWSIGIAFSYVYYQDLKKTQPLRYLKTAEENHKNASEELRNANDALAQFDKAIHDRERKRLGSEITEVKERIHTNQRALENAQMARERDIKAWDNIRLKIHAIIDRVYGNADNDLKVA